MSSVCLHSSFSKAYHYIIEETTHIAHDLFQKATQLWNKEASSPSLSSYQISVGICVIGGVTAAILGHLFLACCLLALTIALTWQELENQTLQERIQELRNDLEYEKTQNTNLIQRLETLSFVCKNLEEINASLQGLPTYIREQVLKALLSPEAPFIELYKLLQQIHQFSQEQIQLLSHLLKTSEKNLALTYQIATHLGASTNDA